MSGLSSPGIGSNLDVNGIVSKLMTVEQQPLTRLTKLEASAQARLSAYGLIKNALSTFQSSMSGLASASKYTALSASSSDSTVLSASASSIATPGTYSVEVSKLAKEQKLRSDVLSTSSVNDVVGTGTLTIQLGTYSGGVFTANGDKAATSITIDSSKQSLAGIRDAINSADSGVTATIVNDGSGFRLSLTSNSTGSANSVKISVSGDGDSSDTDSSGLSKLAYDPAATVGAGKNLTESQAAQDAQLTVDGIAVTKPSNTLTDVIQGVTLNLAKESTVGTPIKVSVSRSSSAVAQAAKDFVQAYNDVRKTVGDLTSYTPASSGSSAQAAVLQGEAAPRTILSQLRSGLSQAIGSLNGKTISLSDVGISFQKDGTLALDSSKLNKIVESSPELVAGLFATTGRGSDAGVKFLSSTNSTQPGTYALNVSQMATSGKTVGSGAANLTITDSNKTFNVSIDGSSATVTLGTGTYTAASLAAELQSRINGTSAFKLSGLAVNVSQSSGVMTVNSNSYGSSSKVSISGAGASDLFGGSSTDSTGSDIAGTFNGNAATGSGQTLTSSNGLKIAVNSGNAGDRGNVYFARGFASVMEGVAQALNDTKSGSLTGATTGIQSELKDISSRRTVLNRRLADTETRLRAQFTSLDTMIGKMSSTSTYLTQQLAAIAKNSSS